MRTYANEEVATLAENNPLTENVPTWECLHIHRTSQLFLSEDVDDITMGGTKEYVGPIWKSLQRESGLNDPTPLLNQLYLGCIRTVTEIDQSNSNDEYPIILN